MAALRTGWTYGDRGVWSVGEHAGTKSNYLTVLGSRWKRPVLHATEQAARAAFDQEPYRNNPHMNLEVAHVTETPHGGVSGGYAYRITSTIEN